jgi:hypothetical protein
MGSMMAVLKEAPMVDPTASKLDWRLVDRMVSLMATEMAMM